MSRQNGDARREARGRRSSEDLLRGERTAGVPALEVDSLVGTLSEWPAEDDPVRARLRELATVRRRFGYRRLHDAPRGISDNTRSSDASIGRNGCKCAGLAGASGRHHGADDPSAGRNLTSCRTLSPTAAASASLRSSTTSPANTWHSSPIRRCRACGWCASPGSSSPRVVGPRCAYPTTARARPGWRCRAGARRCESIGTTAPGGLSGPLLPIRPRQVLEMICRAPLRPRSSKCLRKADQPVLSSFRFRRCPGLPKALGTNGARHQQRALRTRPGSYFFIKMQSS
jgi:hypothetical protein